MAEPVVVYEPKAPEVRPAPHSLEENEQTIEHGLGTFVEVGQALMEIKVSNQYIKAGFGTFEDYCKQRWDFHPTWAYRQIGGSRVMAILEANVDDRLHVLPTNIEQTKPLITILNEDGEEAIRTAWTQIVEAHQGDGPITGREVRTFLKPTIGIPPSKRPLSDAYLGALDKLGPAMRSVRWAIETHHGKKVPTPVRERYEVYATSVRALADAMDSVAQGETVDLDALEVGAWGR